MYGTVGGREINQVTSVVARNGYLKVAGIIDKGYRSAPTNNGNERRFHVAIALTDHEGMVGGNSLGQESIGLSTMKVVGGDVYGYMLRGLEGIVRRTCVAIRYSKPRLCLKVPGECAKKDRQ